MSISVIIPTHNRVHTLPRALDSVFSQSLPPLEVIVVDDGSNDGTNTLIKTNYPQCIYLSQPNSGVSESRNTGIKQARGEWIALLDSDDSWLPDKLQMQMESIISSSNLRLSHTDEIWIRNGTRVNQMNKHTKHGGFIFKQCLPLCVISPSAALLHRSIFDEFGLFDPSLPACEDYDMWLRICASEAVDFVDKPLVVKYGGHDDQLSRRHWGMDRFRVYALQKLLENQKLSDSDRLAAIKTLVKKCKILRQGAEKRGHLDRAEQYKAIQLQYEQELIGCNPDAI
ncbi:MAG: glycosyltransferase [Candidatus Thiodiazotropha sp. 6PLUC2]